MADPMRISGPVEIQDTGRHKVAFDLMNRISQVEDGVKKDCAYFLKLYSQCRSVVLDGRDAQSALNA
jgi:hypothetical protein